MTGWTCGRIEMPQASFEASEELCAAMGRHMQGLWRTLYLSKEFWPVEFC